MRNITMLLILCLFAFSGCENKANVIVEQQKETVTCDTEEDKCSITCQSGCCLAIYWPDTGECSTSCDCEKIPVTNKSMDKNTKVTMVAKNIKLSRIAMALNNIKDNKIYVPAEKSDTVVSISIKNVNLTKALESMNLIVVPANPDKK